MAADVSEDRLEQRPPLVLKWLLWMWHIPRAGLGAYLSVPSLSLVENDSKVIFYYRRWLLYLYRILFWLTTRQGETSEPSHERKVVYDILLQLLRHNHELCCSLCSKFRRNREGRMAQVWSLGRPLDQNAGRDEWQDSWVPGWFLL